MNTQTPPLQSALKVICEELESQTNQLFGSLKYSQNHYNDIDLILIKIKKI